MDKLQISQIIKELISQGYPEPIIGGTCSLFLQGFDIEPNDIDLYYTISKEDFLHQIRYRRCPEFPISIDWNFYPDLDLEFQEIEIEDVKLKVQRIEDVLNYKLEGLEEDYFPKSKRNKHLKFFKNLISNPKVPSNLKSRINQILDIMPRIFENLQIVKEQLFDAPTDVKESFNKMIQYFAEDFEGNRRSAALYIKRLIDPYLKTAKGIREFKVTDVERFEDIKITPKDIEDINRELIKNSKNSHIYPSDTSYNYEFTSYYINLYKQPLIHIKSDGDHGYIDIYPSMRKYIK